MNWLSKFASLESLAMESYVVFETNKRGYTK